MWERNRKIKISNEKTKKDDNKDTSLCCAKNQHNSHSNICMQSNFHFLRKKYIEQVVFIPMALAESVALAGKGGVECI